MTKSEFAEILTRATEGDHTALGRIFELYMPLIDKHSVVGGRLQAIHYVSDSAADYSLQDLRLS